MKEIAYIIWDAFAIFGVITSLFSVHYAARRAPVYRRVKALLDVANRERALWISKIPHNPVEAEKHLQYAQKVMREAEQLLHPREK